MLVHRWLPLRMVQRRSPIVLFADRPARAGAVTAYPKDDGLDEEADGLHNTQFSQGRSISPHL